MLPPLSDQEMQVYLKGEKLFGDDFDLDRINAWLETEREGYSSIVRNRDEEYEYHYHALNDYHGFSRIDLPEKAHALGIGSAFGAEFLPAMKHLGKVDIIDPSDDFHDNNMLKAYDAKYTKPRPDGQMPFANDMFDLITAFGVLHHIPNVSSVIAECYRTLKPGGYMLTREPIVSQGDWRRPRGILTQYERGIPAPIFHDIVSKAGFKILSEHLCDFSPFIRLMSGLGYGVYGSHPLVKIDHALSNIFAFNRKYHRPKFAEKFGPASIFYVLRKPAGASN